MREIKREKKRNVHGWQRRERSDSSNDMIKWYSWPLEGAPSVRGRIPCASVCPTHAYSYFFFLCLVKYQIFRVDTVIIKEKKSLWKDKKTSITPILYIFFKGILVVSLCFWFFIIFIFDQIENYPSSYMIITKKPL